MRAIAFLSLAGLLAFNGCNLYGFMDKPSGDLELLSAARGCLDRADFTCATTYYGEMSSTYADTKNSEDAYAVLANYGITMVALGGVLGLTGTKSPNGGEFFTRIATIIAGHTPGETARLAIFHALQSANNITDTALQGYVRFLTSAALVGEVMAEDAGSTTLYQSSDLVADPTSCAAANIGTCAVTAGCDAPTGKLTVQGTDPGDLTSNLISDSAVSGAPSFWVIDEGLQALNNSLSAAFGGNGAISSASGGAASTILADAGAILTGPSTADAPCFRWLLLSQSFGTN